MVNHSSQSSFLGQLPKRIIIALVDQEAFNGSLSLNPYNFKHFNHNHISIKTDSNLTIEPLEPNFDKGHYMQSYVSLFTATGINYSNKGILISHSDYPNGYCLSSFDLTSDLCSSQSYLRPTLSGNIGLDIKFNQTLKKPITIIVYAEFQNAIEINRFRRVTTDYLRL